MKIYTTWQGKTRSSQDAAGFTTFNDAGNWRTEENIEKLTAAIKDRHDLRFVWITNVIELTDESEGGEKTGSSVPVEKLERLLKVAPRGAVSVPVSLIRKLISEAK